MAGKKRRLPLLRTLLVLAAFVALLAYVLLVELKREPPPDPEATPTPWPILGWAIDDLRTVRLHDFENNELILQCGTLFQDIFISGIIPKNCHFVIAESQMLLGNLPQTFINCHFKFLLIDFLQTSIYPKIV